MTTGKGRPSAVRGPGRPRDEELAKRVRAAARAEVSETGVNEVTLASIARRAGVAKSTVYVRWPSALDLLAESLVEIVDFGSVPDTGTLRGDLLALARRIIGVSMVSPMLELHLHFTAMGDRAPEIYRRFHERDMGMGVTRARVAFERARDREEIPGSVDLDTATSAFIGALLMQALISAPNSMPDTATCAKIVDLFADGLVGSAGTG